jgi:6-phosphofructokinase 1
MQTIPPMQPLPESLEVSKLGPCLVPSPLALSTMRGDELADYVPDDARIFYDVETRAGRKLSEPVLFEKAGPREKIFFDPKRTRVGIVTCGGLCPGINHVIRSMVFELHHKYGVERVLGFRYGYAGLDPSFGVEPMVLTPDEVKDVHRHGGSFLGLSRGERDVKTMVDTLVSHGIQVLFTIGGDGTLRGAHAIWEEAKRRGLKLAVVGVPKTIDNDIEYIDKTFGYETAVEVARQAVDAAHTEAIGAFNGVGIVKLMGRASGFIAASATIASHEVNYCLIPEVQFSLDGPKGLLAELESRLAARHHALIVIAEGCGESLAGAGAERDASGNIRFSSKDADVGPRLRDAITSHFRSRGEDITVKYIDPSYMIRSVPANAHDSIFCDSLARNAVHAGMAGKTDIVIGRLHRVFTHVPLGLLTSMRKRVNPDGALWLAVTEATGQPSLHD